MKQKIQELIISEMAAIANIPIDGSFEDAIELIYKQVHEKNGKLITSGIGLY